MRPRPDNLTRDLITANLADLWLPPAAPVPVSDAELLRQVGREQVQWMRERRLRDYGMLAGLLED